MSVRVTIVSLLQTGVTDRLLPFLQENLPNVRGFAGCLQVTVLMSEDRQVMSFDEVWLSREHHERYMAFIDTSGVLATLASFLSAAPTINYFEVVEI